MTSAGKQAACESARRHDATGRASRAARVLCCETARSSVGEGQQRWRRRAQTEEEAAEVGQAACFASRPCRRGQRGAILAASCRLLDHDERIALPCARRDTEGGASASALA